jgi:hypothetical protein
MRVVPSSYTDVDQSTQRRTKREESSYSYEMYSVEMQSSFKVGGFVHNAWQENMNSFIVIKGRDRQSITARFITIYLFT